MNSAIEARPLPSTWTHVRLGEVCEINPRRPELNRSDDAPTSFVPMAAVDGESGTISRPEIKPYGAVKKGYTWFAENDVLFAKITPCMQNGKHAVARSLIDGIGFGTTEFHVLRPTGRVSSEWIQFFVRQPQLLMDATVHFSGAVGQQRLPESYLRELELPLPPMSEQKRIAVMLNEQMATTKRAADAMDTQAEFVANLPRAFLARRFGEANVASAPRRRVSNLCQIAGGGTPSKDRPEYWGGSIPWVTVKDMKGRTVESTNLAISENAVAESAANVVPAGTVLVLVRGMGLANGLPICEVRRPSAFNQDIKGLICGDSVSPAYLAWALRQKAGKILGDRQTVTHGTLKLDTDSLLGVEIPVPPPDVQARVVRELDDDFGVAALLAAQLDVARKEIEVLPSTLLRRAFAGEL